MLYVDASALVKHYVREAGSRTVRRLLAAGPLATSRLTEVEAVSAIVRRAREGAISVRSRDRAISGLLAGLEAFHIVEVVPEVTSEAIGLLQRRAVRASDAIHLASCLLVRRALDTPVTMLAFDARLREAAAAERLAVRP